MNPFVERHQDQISGVLSCFDRVIITGTLPDIAHAGAMEGFLRHRNIRLFDYPRWAEPLRDELRRNAEQLATEAGLEIEFIRRLKAFRKEARIKEILAERGDHPGLVHIFSAMEACSSYRAWYDKLNGQTHLKPTSGKCLHYYFYFAGSATVFACTNERTASTKCPAESRDTSPPGFGAILDFAPLITAKSPAISRSFSLGASTGSFLMFRCAVSTGKALGSVGVVQWIGNCASRRSRPEVGAPGFSPSPAAA